MVEANKALFKGVRRVGLQFSESEREDGGEVCVERCPGSILLAMTCDSYRKDSTYPSKEATTDSKISKAFCSVFLLANNLWKTPRICSSCF